MDTCQQTPYNMQYLLKNKLQRSKTAAEAIKTADPLSPTTYDRIQQLNNSSYATEQQTTNQATH